MAGTYNERMRGNGLTIMEDRKTTPVTDRLSSTLFVAALAHGIVILGVTFTAGPLGEMDAIPTLKVTLLADSDVTDIARDDADYLAQRDQRGAGARTLGDRPTTTLSADHLVTQPGDQAGADPTDGTPREALPSAEQVVTRALSPEQIKALPEPTEAATEKPQTAAALIRNPSAQTLAAEVDLTATLPDQDNDGLLASPDTRASALANYLDAWRRRVERIGTANFPDQARNAPANPTLEVTVGPEGQLEKIVVRSSSGNSAVDQAALTILRLAAPFDPLPQSVRAEYDVLRFAYEWDFRGESGTLEVD